MQLRNYEYRIYPSRKHQERLLHHLNLCRQAYNELLGLNKKLLCARQFDLNGLIKDLKLCNPAFKDVHSQALQNVSDRLSKAFQAFFRRVKNGERKKGYPRFKSSMRSLTYPQSGFKILSDKGLRVSKIGSIPLRLHRIPKGKIKMMTLKRNHSNQWFAIFSCELPDSKVKHFSQSKIGIDIGLESFAVTSEPEVIANPQFSRDADKKIKRLQRRLSRKVKGSSNRKKARLLLAKSHLNIFNRRRDFLHKLSHRLAKAHKFIAVEDLNIKRMVRNHNLARSIHDASWHDFIRKLEYKAVAGGSAFVKVNPRNTSKTCSACGAIKDIALFERTFRCSCGFVCHRDLNAAHNILYIGQGLPESTPVDIAPLASVPRKLSVVSEAGTTYRAS